jgi:hypothetical protein
MASDRRQFLGSLVFGAASLAVSNLSAQPDEQAQAALMTRHPSAQAVGKPIVLSLGRQLFVDDLLVDESTLKRTFHTARLHECSPVLIPETPLEMNNGFCPVACPFDDGVFFDPKDQLFKMWYQAGWFDGNAYAISEDGVHWKRTSLDIEPGTNRVLPRRDRYQRDGAGVWLDHHSEDTNQRFKMFTYFRERKVGFVYGQFYRSEDPTDWQGGELYTSPDGIHWSTPVKTGPCGDNTTFFYNPFRKTWFYSVRTYDSRLGRVRSYRECAGFLTGARWTEKDLIFWAAADDHDLPDPELGYKPELYKLNVVAYETLLLGMFAIFKGPPNPVAEKARIPKTIDLEIGFSRDGIEWQRPDRRPFIACSREKGTWNRGYLHSAGGVCLIMGDELYFYFGAWSGISPKFGEHMYAGGSTGIAVLRRDGFASMDADAAMGSLTTPPVTFKGKHLFVNVNAKAGELRTELLGGTGEVIGPFSRESCVPIHSDSTLHPVTWKSGNDLSALSGRILRFKFYLREGQLYSFWISPDLSGTSGGYQGAGGPKSAWF